MKPLFRKLFRRKKLPEGFKSLEEHLKSASFEKEEDGRYKCTIAFSQNLAMMLLTEEIARYYRECKADNYVSMRFHDPKSDQQYELIVQRCEGKTPAERVHELEKEIKLLKEVK